MGSGFGGMVFSLLTGEVVAAYSYVPVFIGFGLMPLLASAILITISWPALAKVRASGGHA
jgi:ACS family hexuronate transporter-like MFS transporter